MARGERRLALRMCAFHCWYPTRTLTVFCIRPAETTTAGICRVAARASLGVDIWFLRVRRGMDRGCKSWRFWGSEGGFSDPMDASVLNTSALFK